jgi:predicted phosphodiesterase
MNQSHAERLRLALLSDIHGNPLALEAVLADISAQGGVDAYWVLGDFAALGYDPVGAIGRAIRLPKARFSRGNTDRYLVTGERPPPRPADVAAEPGLLGRLLELTAAFAWTLGAVTAAGWFDWLSQLPLEQRLTLPDGTRLLGVHAAPGADDGPGLHPKLSDAALGAALAGCEAELVVVGHTHVPLDRTIDGIRVVNLGSLSNPLTADLRASYALLEADAGGYRLERRCVDYDRSAVLAAIEAVHHPASALLARFIRGEVRSPWAAAE